MEQRLAEEASKARRYCLQLSILLFDLDHFKLVNDEPGHQAGDRILIEIGRRKIHESLVEYFKLDTQTIVMIWQEHGNIAERS